MLIHMYTCVSYIIDRTMIELAFGKRDWHEIIMSPGFTEEEKLIIEDRMKREREEITNEMQEHSKKIEEYTKAFVELSEKKGRLDDLRELHELMKKQKTLDI